MLNTFRRVVAPMRAISRSNNVILNSFFSTSSRSDLVDDLAQRWKGIVVGQIEEIRQHPQADRLSVCLVNIGKDENLQIICGAPNVAVGQKVPVATIGTRLSLRAPAPSKEETSEENETPAPAFVTKKIKKSKLRGELSQGMICSAEELRLEESSNGIMELEVDAECGMSFAEYHSPSTAAKPKDSREN